MKFTSMLSRCMNKARRLVGGAVMPAVFLAVPLFAFAELTGRFDSTLPRRESLPIASEDDLAAFGLNTTRAAQPAARLPAETGAEVPSTKLLRNWYYTGRPGSSGQV